MKKIFIASIFCLVLIACDTLTGEEVARLPINKTSNAELVIKETKLFIKKDEKINIWTEMDMEYEGEIAMVYTLEVWRDTTRLAAFDFDALETNPTFMEVKTSFGDKTNWSYTGKIDFFTVDEDDEYKLRAIIKSSDNPTLKLKKAELIFKK